ncbi:zinc finger protein 300 [Bombina bombina]|uniref:zinc finger protein 300 n=1 Tax=Bombina bombina TaxID=8345 RepID=UPI00235A9461|nr:zinc finger protein 300 [Bombina bombina]
MAEKVASETPEVGTRTGEVSECDEDSAAFSSEEPLEPIKKEEDEEFSEEDGLTEEDQTPELSEIFTVIIKEEPEDDDDTEYGDSHPDLSTEGTMAGHQSQRVKNNIELIVPKPSTPCVKGNLAPAPVTYAVNSGFGSNNNVQFTTGIIKMDDSLSTAKQGSHIAICVDHNTAPLRGMLCTCNKIRKQIVVNKPHSCHICGKCYYRKSHLTVHIRSHTGERPYVCQECGKGFYQSSALIKHQMSHTGEKPYICSECGKGFATNWHMVKHYKSHTREKPYVCNECGKSFTQRTNLNLHQKTHIKE